MNIFFLAADPAEAAVYHCNKHVVKMVLESAQMLSTAHRLTTGVKQKVLAPNGKSRIVHLLPGESVTFIERSDKPNAWSLKVNDRVCYSASHVGHPCTKWVQQSASNYRWLYELMIELDRERQHRFTPKIGKTVRELGGFLAKPPLGLIDRGLTAPAQAMPDVYKRHDAIEAYRSYYVYEKRHIAAWSKRPIPPWFN